MAHLLFHAGNKVRLHDVPFLQRLNNSVAYVIHTVNTSASWKCPHCGMRCGANDHIPPQFVYYLDIPHPTQCCIPFGAAVLYNHKSVCDVSFASVLSSLMAEGNNDGY